MGTLPAILKAIALNNKLAESRELATILQTSLVRKLRVQNKGLRDLGVKQAPFVVLIGAQMPSVLAEIAFLTNKSEAALLKQQATASRSPRRCATRSSISGVAEEGDDGGKPLKPQASNRGSGRGTRARPRAGLTRSSQASRCL